nr:integrase, catalytic region, zinc finger, CCHC-type, peptidase aspartic, catalytic [Tanacetum cinerariifolium]
MHNNIMAAGSRDRPPMLATRRYPQWRSRFLRYIDTRPNGDALRKCILNGPYKPTTVLVQAIAATDDSPAIPEYTTVETPMNMSPANKAYFKAEKEVIHLILTGIGDEIYSTVDAFQTAQEMWEAIKRLQQGESLNIQDPEWSRFVTIVKQQHKLDEVSYHKLFDILKQYQEEVNELCKEIAKPITPLFESASEEDSDPEQAQRDKDMQKNLALIAKKPKRVKDSAYHKENMLLCKQAEKGVTLQAEQYDWLAGTDEEIDEQELVAHYSYMEKIQEVPTADTCTNSELLEKVQNDTGYNVFANDLQYSEQSESISNTCIVETDDSNVIPNSPDMCNDDIQNDQNDVESDDERVTLANLITNLKLDVNENKKIQKQLKKSNTTLSQELKECKTILTKTSKTLGESNSVRDSCLVALQNKQTEFEKYKAFNDRTIDYDKLERKLNETLVQLAQKDIEIKEGLKLKAYEILVVKEKHDELIKQSLLTKPHYEGLVMQKTKVLTDLKLKEEHDIDKILSIEKQLKFLNYIVYKRSQSIQTIHMMAPKVPAYNGRPTFANLRYLKQAQSEIPCLQGKSVETMFDEPSVVRQPNAQRIPKPSVLGKTAPFLDSLEIRYFSKTKSVPKTNVSKGLSKPVTAHTLPQTARQVIVELILFIIDSRCTKHMTGNLKLLCNFIEKFLGTVCFGNDQFAPILGYEDLVQGNIMINRVYYVEGLNHNLFLVDGENLDKMKEKGDPCILIGYFTQSKGYHVYNKRTRLIVESIYIRFDEIKEMFKTSIANDALGLVPQRQQASDYDNSDPVPQLQNVSSSVDAHVPS